MPRDPRKHQKALMKKRSKEKAAAQHRAHRPTSITASSSTILLSARSYPVLECWISASWQEDEPGLVQILLARQQPNGDICFGGYLVDKLCLGLKNTYARTGISRARYQSEVRSDFFRETESQACPVELAHQMIYASIDYAAKFGFQPEKDFATSQYLLAPHGELAEPYELTFGRDGKPFFIAGPYDNATRILKQLEKTAGPGNYDYLVALGPPDAFEDF